MKIGERDKRDDLFLYRRLRVRVTVIKVNLYVYMGRACHACHTMAKNGLGMRISGFRQIALGEIS